MAILIVGLILMIGIHLVPAAPDLRDRMKAALGDNGYRILFSVVSLAGLALVVWGYGQARLDPTVLYVPPTWLRHIALLLLVPVFPLLFAAYLPGRIKAAVRHPMLAAVKLWALAHLLANGTLADLLLFGSILAWAVYARIAAKRREAACIAPVSEGTARNDLIAVVAGLALYAITVLWLHEWLFGVSPLA